MNDWMELKAALIVLKYPDAEMNSGGEMSQVWDYAIDTVLKYVPRLLTQYEDLLEMMNQTIDGIREFKRLGEGGQLLVADSQEVRQFGA